MTAARTCLVVGALFWLLPAGVADAAPVASPGPTISGTPQQGQVLTLVQGTWTDTAGPVTVSDQWESCSGATCSAVGTADSLTYQVAPTDVGNTIEVVETATASDGTATATATTTAVLPPPPPPPPADSSLPTISGTPQVGQTLALTHGAWTNTPTGFTDQWESCLNGVCSNVGAVNGLSYLVAATDVGHTIQVVESASNAGGSGSPVTSAPTAAVLPAIVGNAKPPSISGTPQQGKTLTLTQGTWTNAPTSISDQWEDCVGAVCTPIPSATGTTYTPGPTDVGHTIEVVETATNAAGPVMATSAPVGPVSPLTAPADGGPPTISGTAQQGQTLTLTQGTWANGPASVTDQWEDCLGAACSPIPGQTGSTYLVGPGDVGRAIAVAETATNDGGATTADSGRTGIVAATSVTSVTAFSANAPTANQTVTLVATVTSNSGNASPSGALTFLNGSTPVKGCSGMGVNGGQTSTIICQTAFGAGAARISAVYAPGSGSLVNGSRSAPTTVNVGKDSTSVSIAVTAKVARGKPATYSAALVLPASNSGPTAPTGSISFLDRGQAIPACANRPLNNLTATCTVKYGTRGTHDISAVYSGDTNFSGSSSAAHPVQIVKSARAVLAFVKSTLQWTFFYHPTYTAVILFKAFQVATGTRIELTCVGRGCPFRTLQVPARRGKAINLLPVFHSHHLRAGTRVTVRLTHRHWVGKYYSFTIRGGRPPLVGVSCLAVGKSKPGVGC